jgi:hypothetical protein
MKSFVKKFIKWAWIDSIEKSIEKQIGYISAKEKLEMLDKRLAEMKAENLSLSLELKMKQTVTLLMRGDVILNIVGNYKND